MHRIQSAKILGSLAVAAGLTHSLSAFAADFPVGSYAANASITITFDDKGQFHVNDGKTTQVAGRYAVKGDQLEITDSEGPWACTKAGQQTGTYTWKYEHAVLAFSKLADQCEARVGSLTTATWKQSK